MSVLKSLRRLVRLAYPGFPEQHVTCLGVVVAIADAPAEESGTDRFRPRYAVDVQVLTPQGEPDGARPVLQGLPLPTYAGIYAFPELGQRVRIGFDYGLPSHPYIQDVLSEGQPAPALRPGERLWQHSEGHFMRWDAKGNLTIQTDGELIEDSHLRTIAADAAEETLGELTRTVEGEQTETIGTLTQTIQGALQLRVGADVKVAILGVEDRVVAGDKSEIVGGKLEIAANLGIRILVVPGVGTVYIGNGIVELLHMVDTIITQLQLETHTYVDDGTPAPTTPPLNLLLYLAEQVKLATIKTAP
jgi:hypothetical protein